MRRHFAEEPEQEPKKSGGIGVNTRIHITPGKCLEVLPSVGIRIQSGSIASDQIDTKYQLNTVVRFFRSTRFEKVASYSQTR